MSGNPWSQNICPQQVKSPEGALESNGIALDQGKGQKQWKFMESGGRQRVKAQHVLGVGWVTTFSRTEWVDKRKW